MKNKPCDTFQQLILFLMPHLEKGIKLLKLNYENEGNIA